MTTVSLADPDFFPNGIRMGSSGTIIGIDKDSITTLQVANFKSTNLTTTNLTLNGIPINGVSKEVANSPNPNYLLTLGGITQYVQSQIKSIKTIEVDKTCISIGGTPNAGIITLKADTTKIHSTNIQFHGNFKLGSSFGVTNISNLIFDSQSDLAETLPTAKAVIDYVSEKIKSTRGESLWKEKDINNKKSISYLSGSVGIGADEPQASLHVASGAIMPSSGNTKDNGIVFPSNPGKPKPGVGDSAWIRHYAKDNSESCVLEIGISNDQGSQGDHIAICPSGLVGIGTRDPKNAMVHIAGSSRYNLGGHNFLSSPKWSTAFTNFGMIGNYGGGDADYSLYAAGRIAAYEFNAFSDARIKEVCGHSDGMVDLATLLNIQVTDYSYKDKIHHGGGQHKKVIGQQIASIFPQAVKTHTDVIPDIYRSATISGGWVQLLDHGLSVGERVRLFWEETEPVIYKIEEASKDSFRVPLQFEGEIFVYGREVDDFHVVDYEAISMLHVSATQELYKIIQGLKQDVEDLKTQLATMNGTGLSPIAHA
jgi:hypothetical protein